jgi:hypothetical protein
VTYRLSRRVVLQQSAAFGALAVLGTACSKGAAPAPVCTDTTGLAAPDVALRTTLGYEDVSTQPGKNCLGCAQFVAGAPSACGTCKILKGPVSPGGYCKSFTAKPA